MLYEACHFLYHNVHLHVHVILLLAFRRGLEDRVYCKPLESVPVSDQHVALGILLELAVQRGSLQHMLEMILLLLELWDSGQDNDTDACFTSAPLVPLLLRFQELSTASSNAVEPNKLVEEVRIVFCVSKMYSNRPFQHDGS